MEEFIEILIVQVQIIQIQFLPLRFPRFYSNLFYFYRYQNRTKLSLKYHFSCCFLFTFKFLFSAINVSPVGKIKSTQEKEEKNTIFVNFFLSFFIPQVIAKVSLIKRFSAPNLWQMPKNKRKFSFPHSSSTWIAPEKSKEATKIFEYHRRKRAGIRKMSHGGSERALGREKNC